MKQVTILQNKHFEVNEILNFCLKEFDDTIALVNNVKQEFCSELQLANQRNLVFKADFKEIKEIGKYQSILLLY